MKKQEQIKEFSELKLEKLPEYSFLPEIELYMDQILPYISKHISDYSCGNNEKLVTPSIINNYVKSGVISPPVNKKYSRDHIAALIGLCILKQSFPLTTISQFSREQKMSSNIAMIYNSFVDYQTVANDEVAKRISDKLKLDKENANPALMALEFAILANTYKLFAQKMIDIIKEEPINNTEKKKK